jgi:tetratricopeptide (TPR) repeat protein
MHPSPRCVVELRTTHWDGTTGLGSGYLVAKGWVLTAAHVVAGKSSVRAWVDPQAALTVEDESTVDLNRIVQLPSADWALVPVLAHQPPAGFTPVVFGSLDRESADPVQVLALGLPWFRRRDRRGASEGAVEGPARVREVVAAGGQIIPAGGQKTGVLTMTVVGAPDSTILRTTDDDRIEPHGARSVWEGMSGAAVWAGPLLVGVVVRHELAEGVAALTVHPVPDLPEQEVCGWPDDMPRLGDPVPVESTRTQVAGTYRRTAARLAPVLLSGRADEVTALEAFAVGSRRWWWLSASAFAGKTALTAWWVACRSDSEVAVVACFLRRAAGQNTGDHVVRAWAEQLGALAGLPAVELRQLRSLAADAAGITRLEELIEEAARHCSRVVLVVDGLDEYASTGTVPISEWLPDVQSLPAEAALMVTSRTGAPDGVPTGHPLKQHLHRLHSSPVAAKVRDLAEAEIETALQDPARLDHRILGFLAAAEGPLSSVDLATFIQRAGADADPSDIDTVWRRHLARTLTHEPGVAGSAAGGYAFGHDALRDSARTRFANDLPSRREVLHQCAAEYAAQGWPADTPAYLLHSYPRMLVEQWRLDRQVVRLSHLVTDRSRHDRLREVTGGDSAALAEQTMAIQLLTTDPSDADQLLDWRPGTCTHPQPDLDLLATVVWHRDRLHHRNRAVPVKLPAVWVILGQPRRAESMARAIPEGPSQARALANVAITLTRVGRLEDAQRVAADIDDYSPRVEALIGLAGALAGTGRLEDAEWVVADIDDPVNPTKARAHIAVALARAGRLQDARRVAADIEIPSSRVETLAWIGEALAGIGHLEDAQQVAREAAERGGTELVSRDSRSGALTTVAQVLTGVGDPEGAKWVLEEAERAASAIERPRDQTEALAKIAEVLASVGDLEEAQRVAGKAEEAAADIDDGWMQKRTLTRIAELMVGMGQLEAAERIIADFDAPLVRAGALARIAAALTSLGRRKDLQRVLGEAELLVAGVAFPEARVQPLIGIAEVMASAGQFEDAERVAAGIVAPDWRATTLARVAEALFDTGKFDDARRIAAEAERAATDIFYPQVRASALTRIAEVLAGVGHIEDAERVVAGISTPRYPVRTNIDDSALLVEALVNLAEAVAGTGRLKDAQRIAEEAERGAADIGDSQVRLNALTNLAAALTVAGELEAAEHVAANIKHLASRVDALAKLVDAFAGLGQIDYARQVARQVAEQGVADLDDPESRVKTLLRITNLLAGVGEFEYAHRVIGEAERAVADLNRPGDRTEALAQIAEAWSSFGRFDEARRVVAEAKHVAEGIGEYWLRSAPLTRIADALTEIAEALVEAGELEDAKRLVDDIGDPRDRANALTKLAKAMAGVGELRRAREVVAGLDYPDDRAGALAGIVEALVGAGQLDDARRIAGEAELAAANLSAGPRWEALTRILESLARVGQLEDAQRLTAKLERNAVSVDSPNTLAEALTKLAEALISSGQVEDAHRIAANIDRPDSRTATLVQLADELAKVGQLEDAYRVLGEAERAAANIGAPGPRWNALARIQVVLAEIGQLDDAHRITEELERGAVDTHPGERDRVLAALAEALAVSGQLDDAQRIAADLAPECSQRALTAIAVELARTGDLTQAARTIAAVWTVSEWTTPLSALALVSHSALVALSQLELNGHRLPRVGLD